MVVVSNLLRLAEMAVTTFKTHDVVNQVPAFVGRNLFSSDPLLRAIAEPELSGASIAELELAGAFWGTPEAFEMARLANTRLPILKTHDSQGHVLDMVEYHPAYHALMRRSIEAGLASMIWESSGDDSNGRNLLRAARLFMTVQTESGHLCPVTMTNASLAAIHAAPDLFGKWAAKVVTRKYDHRFLPVEKKAGVMLGMGMTEKQGGTDVRSNATRAVRDSGELWRITGHKWFLSAPMCDAFLILAQTDVGLTCFLTPRFLPDGTVNEIRLQRLKDKLGNRSNASCEVEFQAAGGFLVGAEGRGIQSIIQMVTLTRLDCAVASAGLMRAALARAVHHARHRTAFQMKLIDKPLMSRTLADMSLDVAAASALALRLAIAYDRAGGDGNESAYARLMTPAVKYWVCKITPSLVYEAMECLGGNGYVEDADMPRIYREAPVNAIWEGSGNVMCLDVLRVIGNDPVVLDKVLEDLANDLGPSGPASTDVLQVAARACREDEGSARILTEQLAITAGAAALRRFAPGLVADAFLDTRLGGQWRATYGMLAGRYDAQRIVDSQFPPPDAGS
jgi:putative acyl-CoA dehydrogenase